MTLKQPSITVVILNYNGADLTIECVSSVLKTKYSTYDILIVDNYSIDNDFEKLKNKYKSNKLIKIIRTTQNLQFTGGFNYGTEKATSTYVVLLSNDIVVAPDWLNELVKVNKKNAKYIVQPKILSYYNKNIIDTAGGQYTFPGYGSSIGLKEIDKGQYDNNSTIDYACATTLMLKRSFFLELGGYDESFISHYEDVDLALRAQKLGGKCIFVYRSKIYHRGSVTYKKYVHNDHLSFIVRRNRIWVILKNYTGIKKYIRLFGLLLTYVIIINSSVTLRAVRAGLFTNKRFNLF